MPRTLMSTVTTVTRDAAPVRIYIQLTMNYTTTCYSSTQPHNTLSILTSIAGSILSVCEAFCKFVESLQPPVIPPERHADCMRAMSDPEASRMVYGDA